MFIFWGRIEIGVRFNALLLVLSTLATTLTTMVRCTMRVQTAATTGLVRRTPERMHTSCTSVAPVSALRITTFVATVTLFAASGGERGVSDSFFSLLYPDILSPDLGCCKKYNSQPYP